MTLSWSKQRALIASALLVLVTNAIALGGVAYNRSGEPRSALELTERELALSPRDWLDNDNSGISLDVTWRVRFPDAESTDPYSHYFWGSELHWLSEAQKQQLGFATPAATSSDDARSRSWDPPARGAFVVLENDGAAYRAAVEHARRHLARQAELATLKPGVKEFEERLSSARKDLEREESRASRLFVIDVGPNADALRKRYADRKRYAIVPARLDAHLEGDAYASRSAVYVESLDIETISVPHPFRAIVEPLVPQAQVYPYAEHAPRFAATVRWGRRFEPWIVQLQTIERREP